MNKNKVIVIAEAGVNHNGLLRNALQMIKVASKAGADFIKFQTFEPDALSNANLGLANYQKKFSTKNNHLEMLKKLRLSENDFKKIKYTCQKKKIKFLSSPFDIKSIKLLNALRSDYFKIPSGQIDDVPFLEFIGKLNKKIFLSTGASTLSEVKNAIKILSKNGTSKKNIEILHCVSQYPASNDNLNLNSIKYLRNKLNLPVGFSDHTISFDASLLAIGLGARVVEKHFTLNKNQKGPDHQFSLNPAELGLFIKKIRLAEKALGRFEKKPKKDELVNINFIRKKIIATKDINIGDFFSAKNISTKRSVSGLAAKNWRKILGKKSKKNYKINQGI